MIAEKPPAWHAYAACAGADTDLFFPRRGAAGGGRSTGAHLYCSRCPVRTNCLDYAMANNIAHGVWGGTSERERKRLRAERSRREGRRVVRRSPLLRRRETTT